MSKKFASNHEFLYQRSLGCMNDDSGKICDDSDNEDTDSSLGLTVEDMSKELPLHCPRTFSEYYFGTKLQNPKQVITHHFEEYWPAEDRVDLMVNQLWMLVMVDGE
jgi:hypothetical protein